MTTERRHIENIPGHKVLDAVHLPDGFRFRTGFFGKLILQKFVGREWDEESEWRDRWIDAAISDLT